MLIDKLEVMIPTHAPFAGDFAHIHRELRREPEFGPFKPSKHYRAVADLRPFKIPAIIHLECKNSDHHKLELIDSGTKSFTEMLHLQEQVFNVDPMLNRVGRVDLCTDVAGVSLGWFNDHARVEFKQWLCRHSKIRFEVEVSEMGKKIYQSLYFGKRPVCVRIYDKLAERHGEFVNWCGRQVAAARKQYQIDCEDFRHYRPDDPLPALCLPELPSFEQWLAHELPHLVIQAQEQPELMGMQSPEQVSLPILPTIVTRVESQIGGGRVPSQLETVAHLWTNAADFNPFARLQLAGCGRPAPDLYERDEAGRFKYTLSQWMAGKWIRDNWKQTGAAQMNAILNRDRNRKWCLEFYKDFLPAEEEHGITVTELFEQYRESVSKQLAA